MNRVFILLISLFIYSTAYSEFQFITTNADLDEIYYIDISSLDKVENNHKTVKVLINYQNGFMTENGSLAFSAIEENLYDCTKDTVENNFIEYYEKTNGRGDMVFKNDELAELFVNFDTPEYTIKEKICG
jgi:hypothetical protein